jgi:transposase
MAKFNLDFKVQVVSEYLNGAGSVYLARKYHIAKHDTVMLWVHRFEKYGISGLKVQEKQRDYSGEFKIQVLDWKQRHQASLSETALHFNITSPSVIYQWQRRLDLGGIDSLVRKRGRPNAMAKRKPKKTVEPTPEQRIAHKEKDELKQLKKENQMLRIENEFLKKLDALSRKKSAQKRSLR